MLDPVSRDAARIVSVFMRIQSFIFQLLFNTKER